MKLISVNTGLPREVTWHGRSVTTGIFKQPVEGRITLRKLNLDGDRQADLAVHGGPDKVVYAYVPQMIKYYLAQDAILPNVPTYLCFDDSQRSHVLANLDKLVVKPANESGGYGMLIGPRSTRAEQDEIARQIEV